VRALILSPTRELALQINEQFVAYGKGLRLRSTVIFGGVGDMPQKNKLRQGVEILVATPGRLMDLLGQKALTLDHVEVFTLDEADRMLDMGFIHDVRRIAALLPQKRQTLLFSATMPPEIRSLAKSLLHDPVNVEVNPVSSTAAKIEQSVYHVSRATKPALLGKLLGDPSISRALVFTRTKHGADKVVRALDRFGVGAEAIHGNKAQNARQRALSNFKNGSTRVLVATDIASRGIDVQDISHVFNYDLPEVAESYVHRIGRTGRNGASGTAIAFCDGEERSYLRQIERVTRMALPVAELPKDLPMPAAAEVGEPRERDERPQGRFGGRPEGRGQGGGRPGAGRPYGGSQGRSQGSAPSRTRDDNTRPSMMGRQDDRRGGYSSPARDSRGGDRPQRSEGSARPESRTDSRTFSNPASERGRGPRGSSQGSRDRHHDGRQADSRGGNAPARRRPEQGEAPARKDYVPFWKRFSRDRD
jgi:ATP-dependent RNA helicase RhlE